LHTMAERYKQSVTRPTRPHGRSVTLLMEHGADQAPVLLLHLKELRHGRPHAQVLRISCVDPADHGLRHALQRLAPQTARDEVRQRFVIGSGAPWYHKIECHTQLATPAKHRRGDERAPRPGSHEVKPLRYGEQFATTHNKTLAVLGGSTDELIAQS